MELSVPPDVKFASLVRAAIDDAAMRAELDVAKSQALTEAAIDGFRTIVEEAMAEAREPISNNARPNLKTSTPTTSSRRSLPARS